jgi:galactose mutarotase-like enzyme
MTDTPLQTVTLLDTDAALEATFVPGAGMLCSSLRHRGEELLAQNAGLSAYARSGKTMGIPLLYPWANRLAAFQYAVAGRVVEVPHDPARIALDDNGLPIHGVIGGRMAWELTRAPGPGGRSLAARLSWSESRAELFEVFPFRHDVHYEARLAGGCLEVEIGVHACGGDVVPLAFGLHPYLSIPGSAREHWLVELPAMRHLELDGEQIPLGPDRASEARSFQLAEEQFDDGFDGVAEPARFSVTGAGRRITLELIEGYPCAQVYAPRGGQFICFEPMTAPTNALRSGKGLRLVAPGERARMRFSVRIEDLADRGTPA